MKMIINRAIYPGSFDPLTNGHLDILKRASKIFERVFIVIATNSKKSYLFTAEEKKKMIDEVLEKEHLENCFAVIMEDDLSVNIAKKLGATTIIRGLRMVSDFEYELQLEAYNKKLNPNVETIFFMSSQDESFVSSSGVKEIAKYHGDISSFVPENIKTELIKKYE